MSELPVFVIYFPITTDYPGKYVLRRQLATKAGEVRPDPEPLALGDTLAEVRAALPPGLYRLHRDESDDPVIAETWI